MTRERGARARVPAVLRRAPATPHRDPAVPRRGGARTTEHGGLRSNPAKASVSRHGGKKSVGEFERLLSLGARPVREGPRTRLGALPEVSSANNATFTTCDHLVVQ